MTNFFEKSSLFKSDCSLNYRLSLLEDFHQYVFFENVYYIDGKLSLYKNSIGLIDIFNRVIDQQRIDVSSVTIDNLKNTIDLHKYIIGLCETSKLFGNKFGESVNNYNMFIIIGYEKDCFLLWCNTSPLGAECVHVNYKNLINMICKDLSVTAHPFENELLGFPLSYLSVKDNINKTSKKQRIKYIRDFYFNLEEKQNYNIFKYFLNTRMDDFVKYKYSGCQYQCAVNLRILKDIAIYHNYILKDICFSSDFIKENDNIINSLTIIISLYAKFIFTTKYEYIERCLFYLNSIVNSVQRNVEIIKLGEWY